METPPQAEHVPDGGEGEEDEVRPTTLLDVYYRIILHTTGEDNIRQALKQFVNQYGLARALSRSEIQSQPYLESRARPPETEHMRINRDKLLNVLL